VKPVAVDDELARLWAARAEDAAAGANCPEAARLWEGLRGELPVDERRSLVNHIGDCAACAEAWRLGHALQEEVQAELGPAVVPSQSAARPGLTVPRWAYALAAGVVVLLGLVIWRASPGPRPGESAYRTAEDAPLRSVVTSRVLPRGDCVLRWTPAATGARYSLLVTDERLTVIVRRQDLAEAEARLPPERLVELPAGAKLLWRVEALLPDGGRIVSSTFVNRIE
jgi:hypothetical protein